MTNAATTITTLDMANDLMAKNGRGEFLGMDWVLDSNRLDIANARSHRESRFDISETGVLQTEEAGRTDLLACRVRSVRLATRLGKVDRRPSAKFNGNLAWMNEHEAAAFLGRPVRRRAILCNG